MIRTSPRIIAAFAAGTLLLAGLAGCGGSDAKKPANTSAASASTNAFVDGLLAAMDAKKSVHVVIDGGSLISATADMTYGITDPKIRLAATFGGGKQDIVVAGGSMYMQQSAGGKYVRIGKDDPTYGSILKTFSGLGPRDSLAGIRSGITRVVKIGSATADGTAVTQYAVTANTSKATGAFKALAGAAGAANVVTMQFYVDASNLLRKIELTVSGHKVSMTLSQWGEPVTIAVPSGSHLLGN